MLEDLYFLFNRVVQITYLINRIYYTMMYATLRCLVNKIPQINLL